MKGNALVIAIGHGKPKGSEVEPKGVTDSDSEDASESDEDKYAEELAGILGVGPADVDDFKTALSGYVKACVAKGSGYDEGDAAEG